VTSKSNPSEPDPSEPDPSKPQPFRNQNGLRVHSMSDPRHHSVEPIVIISSVFDHTDGTIRLGQRVLAFDHVSNPHFGLLLLVTGLGVSHSVFEVVPGGGLQQYC
jgi:hypothetical protein